MSQVICSARIYLKRGEKTPGAGLLNRIFGKQLAHEIVEQALRAGLDFASMTFGQIGFAYGARYVSTEMHPESPMEGLPVCVELLGERLAIERFVEDNAPLFGGAIVVLFDGVRLGTAGEGT